MLYRKWSSLERTEIERQPEQLAKGYHGLP
jgi:hypothetical protein